MGLDSIINLSISASSKTPTRAGFGTALLLVSKVPASWGPNLVRTFGDTTEMTDAGFLVTDPAYRMAAILKAQNPTVTSFKVAKRGLKPTKVIKLTVTIATEGYVYAFKVGTTSISYTVLAAATTSTVATALAALIDADAAVTAAAVGAEITITGAAAGTIFDVEDWYKCKMTLSDTTADPGIATDLAAVWAEDHDWYALAVDSMGKLEAASAAAWVETNKRILVVDNADSECLDNADTDDVMSTLKLSTYTRTGVLISTKTLLHWGSCGWYGHRLTVPPGSDTWKFKSLANVPASAMTEGEKSAVKNKKGNTYTTVAGLNITEEGWTAGGEFFDFVRGLDWLASEIKVRVFARFANAEKVPYTDAGVDLVKSIVLGALWDGVKAGLLANDPEPTVSAPLVADIDSTIRATRNLPGVTFTARRAGAIHSAAITGTVSV